MLRSVLQGQSHEGAGTRGRSGRDKGAKRQGQGGEAAGQGGEAAGQGGEAAEECSPGRKPGVKGGEMESPERAKDSALFFRWLDLDPPNSNQHPPRKTAL
jgi:hypothetical protein